jgi:hypothetical protein
MDRKKAQEECTSRERETSRFVSRSQNGQSQNDVSFARSVKKARTDTLSQTHGSVPIRVGRKAVQ